jgi:threonine/homoserine/homoserine lactone efflux protein
MTPLAVLILIVAPVIAGVFVGRRKGYLVSGIIGGLLLSWLGVLIVALWRPPKAETVRRERARLEAEGEARLQIGSV